MRKILFLVLLIFIGCVSQENNIESNVLPDIKKELPHETNIEPNAINLPQDTFEVDPSFKIPDTNQNTCYDENDEILCGSSFYGQDAQYLNNEPSYKDNKDGTITDLNTGLTWTKSYYGKYNYYDAPSTTGHEWRIPTIKELYTLMDFRGVDPDSQGTSTQGLVPFISEVFEFAYGDVSKGDRIIDSQWITTSVYVSTVMGGEECFFGVNFADGRIKCYPTNGRNNGYYLRYVSGEVIDNDFVDNNDGTITDLTTSLMWTKKDSGWGMNWEDALSYCEDLELIYDDWRLPNIKELQFIVDYSRSPDTTNSPAINPIFETTMINNELGQKDYPYFWSSTTHVNHNGGSQGSYVSFGRALGYFNGRWIDVHGAGAQRSDPKVGNGLEDYPEGHGPQGDAIRTSNYVRCVRGGEVTFNENTNTDIKTTSNTQTPPSEAINACTNKNEGNTCSFNTPKGTVSATCKQLKEGLVCAP